MKVKQLKMTSFRGISDLTLEFDADEPTVFIGINGVGKSSILDCIAILLSRLLDWIRLPTLEERINAKLQGENVSLGSFSEADIKTGCKRTQNEITILINDLQQISWSLTKVSQKNNGTTNGNFAELQAAAHKIHLHWKASHENNIPLAVYYPVNRAVFEVYLELPEEDYFEQIDAYEEALDGVQIGFDSFFQWFRILEDLENEERRDNSAYRNQQLEAVRNAISLLQPDLSNLRVRRSPLRMTVSKQGQELIVNQLSDGEKCLLAMVGDLARRLAIANPGLSDPLQGSGVVLIDEIELHLHPKLQREIIPALTRTFPNCQFIFTTHSPQVVSHVKPESVYILEATPEGIIAKRPESSFGRDSNLILEDLMGVPERPQEIKDRLRELFRLIDAGNLDGARQLRHQLSTEIGYDEPEFVRADVLIRRKEILNR
jgi:predicted ATP-binding protein involved in virulence